VAPYFTSASEIRVGVVGYGASHGMGRAHLDELRGLGAAPAAVADPDPERLKAAKNDFPGIETHGSAAEMLERSSANLVVLATPHHTHAQLALACLRAGRHVVCEKPMALTAEEAEAMAAAAREAGVMLSVFHNQHWDGRIRQAVEEVVNKGTVGEVVKITCRMGFRTPPEDAWRGSRAFSGGILYDQGAHLLDHVFQLIDSEPAEVMACAHEGYWNARTAWKEDTLEDELCALVRFKSGQWLEIKATRLDHFWRSGILEVVGTEGTLVVGRQDSRLFQGKEGQAVQTVLAHPPDERHRFYQNIRGHLLDGEPLAITPQWARRIVQVLEGATRSAREGRSLTFPPG
jgi:predicted dehydrogenase